MLDVPGLFLSQLMGIPQHATYKAVRREHQRLVKVGSLPTAAVHPDAVQATDGGPVSINMAPAFTNIEGGVSSYAVVGLPPGLSMNPGTGLISGTLPALASSGGLNGVYAVTVTANDGCSGIALQTMHIHVRPAQADMPTVKVAT